MPDPNLKKLMNLQDAQELRSQIYTWDTMPEALKSRFKLLEVDEIKDTVNTSYTDYDLVTRRIGVVVDLSNLNWIYHSNGGFYAPITGKSFGTKILCNEYKYSEIGGVGYFSQQENMSIGVGSGNEYIYLKNTTYNNNVAGLKESLHNTILYYILETPYNEKFIKSQPVPRLLENIVDSKGRNRFIQGEGTLVANQFSVDGNHHYSKWTLNGNHLMIVQAGVAYQCQLNVNARLVNFKIPAWVYNKLHSLYSNDVILYQSFLMITSNFTASLTKDLILQKHSNNVISIHNGQSIDTGTQYYNYRIVIDLLIDMD